VDQDEIFSRRKKVKTSILHSILLTSKKARVNLSLNFAVRIFIGYLQIYVHRRKMKKFAGVCFVFLLINVYVLCFIGKAMADDQNQNILKQGLLGAGTGAIASSASGGNAGKGALIGAGTNVIGGALLDTLMGSGSQPAQPQYVQQQPVEYVQQPPAQYNRGYVPQAQPVYVQQAPTYYQPPQQEDPNKKILKQGLLGAGTGAIAASASGGNAGKGALIGAGTNVIGGALLDTLMGGGSSQPQPQAQPVYYRPAPQYQQQAPPQVASQTTGLHKKIIRKYDADGKVVSEEEVWE
jgi:hypothetical protein